MTAPHVTVIIHCQNRAAYISQSIESALTQTYPALDVIVINNGSTDNSADMIAHYAALHPDRLTVITQDQQSSAMSRDVGVERAKGDWVVVLDADDYLFPEAVTTWVNYAQAHPAHRVIFGAWQEVTAGGVPTLENLPHTWTTDPLEGNILATLIRSDDAITPASLIHRGEILRVGGFYHPDVSEAGVGYEHLFLYFRLLLGGVTFGHVPQIGSGLRLGEGRVWVHSEQVSAHRRATYLWAVKTDSTRIIPLIDQVSQIRIAQLKDAFAVIAIRNQEVTRLYGEIETARRYQESQDSARNALREQSERLLTEIETARRYQSYQEQQLTALREQVTTLETELATVNDRVIRDSKRPQQVNALIDHIEALEAELAPYRATTGTDSEARLKDLYTRLTAAEQELATLKATPAARLLGLGKRK